jgi:hypothetical protein
MYIWTLKRAMWWVIVWMGRQLLIIMNQDPTLWRTLIIGFHTMKRLFKYAFMVANISCTYLVTKSLQEDAQREWKYMHFRRVLTCTFVWLVELKLNNYHLVIVPNIIWLLALTFTHSYTCTQAGLRFHVQHWERKTFWRKEQTCKPTSVKGWNL